MAGKGKVDMRNAIVLTTILLILVPACVKAVEPIGWWKFEEKDGNTAKDSSGNGFDAAVILGGGAKIWCPGEGFDSNGCAKFTAQQTVVIPNAIWSRVKDKMSIAFWVNQDASAPPDEKWPGPWGIAPTEGVSFPDPNWLKLRAFVPTPNKAIDIGNDSENVYWRQPPTATSPEAGIFTSSSRTPTSIRSAYITTATRSLKDSALWSPSRKSVTLCSAAECIPLPTGQAKLTTSGFITSPCRRMMC